MVSPMAVIDEKENVSLYRESNIGDIPIYRMK
jgi:hypothetical protein